MVLYMHLAQGRPNLASRKIGKIIHSVSTTGKGKSKGKGGVTEVSHSCANRSCGGA